MQGSSWGCQSNRTAACERLETIHREPKRISVANSDHNGISHRVSVTPGSQASLRSERAEPRGADE